MRDSIQQSSPGPGSTVCLLFEHPHSPCAKPEQPWLPTALRFGAHQLRVLPAGVAECGAAVQCLTLFRQYPFHNLLHHQARPGPTLQLFALTAVPDAPSLALHDSFALDLLT